MKKIRFSKSFTLDHKMFERFIIPTLKVGWTKDNTGLIIWIDFVIWKWVLGFSIMCE